MTREEKRSYKKCTEVIGEAYKNSTTEYTKRERREPYWWNEEVGNKRKQCILLRRIVTRMAKKNFTEEVKMQAKEKYKEGRKELCKLIKKSRKEHWNKLCRELNNDIWGK
ncbi:hypothetical protein QE152_g41187, partial [Popillia japonica]